LTPSSTASAIAPAREAMTGSPNWNAISAFWDAVADRYGSTRASAAAKHAGTSAAGT
jgi:hypothetical protein